MRFPLPNPADYSKDVFGWIKQTELTLHHIRKSFEHSIEGLTQEEINTYYDNLIFCFRHPEINLYNREQDNEGNVKVHVDEEGEQMTEIELEIK